MVAFDAEVYLRRLGERLLDDPDRRHSRHWSALRGAGAALVGAGVIAADRAWRVIDDYATATRIRADKPGFVHFDPPLRFPWTVTPPEIIDSDGNRPAVRFASGGADTAVHVDGELELRGTIAREATWLEIDGTRVDLHRRTARWEVGIEALEDRSQPDSRKSRSGLVRRELEVCGARYPCARSSVFGLRPVRTGITCSACS